MADALASTQPVPEPPIFNGVADVCADIEELATAARRALDIDALCVELQRRKSVIADAATS